MSASVKSQYLKAMGVQTYRLRPPAISAATEIIEPAIEPTQSSDKLIQDPASVQKHQSSPAGRKQAATTPVLERPSLPDMPPVPDDDLMSYMGMDESLPDDYGEMLDDQADLLKPELPAVATLDWQALQTRIRDCQLCGLCKTRKNTVFGMGDAHADVMIIGEAPGVEEDASAKPFAGVAGHLLDNMLKAIGLERKQVFMTNMLKCHPQDNHKPAVDEIHACKPYLLRQIDLIQPKRILSLGAMSAHNLLGNDEKVSILRQQVHTLPLKNIPVHVTYHPAYLLRKPSEKAKSWQDLKRFAHSLQDVQS